MPMNLSDEVAEATKNIDAARAVLESLFERMRVLPRAEKVMVSATVHEACLRLQAAQELLAKLEPPVLTNNGA